TPIAGATVSLSPGGLTTTTNGNGAFTFANVNPGTYKLSTSAALYTTNTQTVTVAAGKTLNVTVRLRTLLVLFAWSGLLINRPIGRIRLDVGSSRLGGTWNVLRVGVV